VGKTTRTVSSWLGEVVGLTLVGVWARACAVGSSRARHKISNLALDIEANSSTQMPPRIYKRYLEFTLEFVNKSTGFAFRSKRLYSSRRSVYWLLTSRASNMSGKQHRGYFPNRFSILGLAAKAASLSRIA
jgi:hypothetical protein